MAINNPNLSPGLPYLRQPDLAETASSLRHDLEDALVNNWVIVHPTETLRNPHCYQLYTTREIVLDGSIKNASQVNTGDTILTLPVEYAPKENIRRVCSGEFTTWFNTVAIGISPTGVVTWQHGNLASVVELAFSGVRWRYF